MTDETIFSTALEKADPAERAAYLNDVCAGDAQRRQRLEALLEAAARADSFLERPAVAASGPDSGETCRLGAEGTAPAEEEEDALAFLLPSSRPDSLGRLGHYEVLEVLGKGGFGIVFRAFDETLQRMVAIKVLAPGLAATSPPRKRFLREARSSAKVRHENVVQVYAVEELPLPYLVMEFIPGETLQQRLDRAGPIETPEVLRIGQQLAAGLAAAHAQGLIHRDIKPGNILLEAGPNQHVKLTDFGLARAADDASLTQSGTIAGTPMFMAPEQAHGDALDHRADLFSLGSVLYTMASGRPPFRANNTLAVLKRVAEDTPRPIREIIPEVPEWLCDLIARLHAKKPADRIATAQEVAELLATPVVAAVDLPNPTPTLRPRGRVHRWAAAAVVFLALIIGLGVTEATGVTNARSTVIRLFAPEGTLEIQVDDPAVSVQIDGVDVVITGAGVKELRLKTGRYTVETLKGGAVVRRELVSVTRDGRNVVRVSQEAVPPEPKDDTAAAWERSVAALPADEQAKAVGARLKQLNPGFDGKVVAEFEGDTVIGLKFASDRVSNIAPVRALTRLRSLTCRAYAEPRGGPLVDLAPLRGLPLTYLDCVNNQVVDLAPLAEMKLEYLNCDATRVTDLSPLRRLPLKELSCAFSKVADLSPLRDMPLTSLSVGFSEVSDLTPLKGLPLTALGCGNTKVTDLAALKGMALRSLHFGNTGVTDLSPLKGMNPVGLFFDSTRVTDLSPLKGMSLQELYIGPLATDLAPIADIPLVRFHHAGFEAQRDAKVLRAIKTLTTINNLSAAEFWKGVDEKSKK